MRNFKKIIAIWVLAFSTMANADDIDILGSNTSIDANILFVMDLSGSMNWCPGAFTADEICPTGPSRLDELGGAFQDIISNPDFEEVKFGLSMFSGGAQGAIGSENAHGIAYPVSPIIGSQAQDILSKTGFIHPGVAPDNSYMPAAGTNNSRQYLSLLSNDTSIWNAYGSTPIVDALYEASLYFRGEAIEAGKFPPNDIRSAHPSTFTGPGFTLTTTTTTPACDATSRVSCTAGSCGATEQCTTSPGTVTSATDTGGCTLNTGVRVGCGYGVPSCGLGTGCTSTDYTFDRYCGTTYTSVSSCAAANPSWYACETYTNTSTVTNSEGQTTTSTTTQVRCKEDLTYYWCDGNNNYSCPTTVESCTKCPDDVTTTTITGSGTYKSPIVDECTKNGIILLSDGGPTANSTADLIRNKIGTYAQGCQNAPSPGTETQVFGRCGPELAKYLAEEDHADGSTSVPNIDGIQNIETYTVGLSLLAGSEEAAYLEEIATEGGGAYVSANDRAELVQAFKDAITAIAEPQARSFAAPSYSVDTSNLLSHGNFVYVPVFDKEGAVWPGNLKKYQLIGGVLSDADGNPAVDSEGALLATARDLWSAVPSTDAIKSGGVANNLNPNTRNIKTDNGSAMVTLDNGIANSEFGITGTGVAENALKNDLVKFIKGINPADDTVRYHMGDILHSKPTQLVKSDGSKTIFVGTNEGYLHAIKDSDGTELFAYMPQELLPNIKKQYEKSASNGHIYGVDGPLTLWLDERNSTADKFGNGVLDSGEKAYLFFGLRRGGKHYYALDVTNPTSPVLKWKNSYGVGDSWSQPVVSMLKLHNETNLKPVLVFGGGYNEDTAGNEITGEGNSVFIVNAVETAGSFNPGDKIWEAPTSTGLAPDGSISHAVPSRIRVIDVDRNGSIDRLYFGDTGGNIWRADLNASLYDSNTGNDGKISDAKLYKIASLGTSGSDGVTRKFFEEPDVAIFRKSGQFVATIAIGSGDRTNPLDETNDDRFFVLYDKEVLVEPSASTLTLNDLVDSSSLSSLSATTNINGWYKDLTSTSGEKVLSTAVTYQNKVMFTTFGITSTTVVAGGCGATNTNEARLYIMDLLSGNEDLNAVAATGEILGTPQIVFNELQKSTGGACVKGDCIRKAVVRVGKAGPFDLPAPGNASPAPQSVPRVFWIDND